MILKTRKTNRKLHLLINHLLKQVAIQTRNQSTKCFETIIIYNLFDFFIPLMYIFKNVFTLYNEKKEARIDIKYKCKCNKSRYY